jgi:hypothetical protein
MLIINIIRLDLITAGSSQCNLKYNYTTNRISFGEITINHYVISIQRKGPKIDHRRNPRTTSDTGGPRMRRIAEHVLLCNIAGCDWMCISKCNVYRDLAIEFPDSAISVQAAISSF